MATHTTGFSVPALQILEQTPRTLRSLLANATRDEFDWQPGVDRWSIGMVLAHLAEVEMNGFVSRFRAMAEQDNPRLPVYDQLALFRSERSFDGQAKLALFEQERSETLTWLKTLPESVGARTGQHEELGVISFGQLLHEFAFHDLGHIRQILELYRSRAFYPHMGGFQSYYKINP